MSSHTKNATNWEMNAFSTGAFHLFISLFHGNSFILVVVIKIVIVFLRNHVGF